MTAAAISEEEESGDTSTGGQNDTHGMTQPGATQLNAMRANKERAQERQKGELQRHSDTVKITTMVNYIGVGRRVEDIAHRDGRGSHRTYIKHFLTTKF